MIGELALPRTPARERLVAAVEAAIGRARDRRITPTTVYLRADTAKACGLKPPRYREAVDPPRVVGLPIRLATAGKNRLRCRSGIVLTIGNIEGDAV